MRGAGRDCVYYIVDMKNGTTCRSESTLHNGGFGCGTAVVGPTIYVVGGEILDDELLNEFKYLTINPDKDHLHDGGMSFLDLSNPRNKNWTCGPRMKYMPRLLPSCVTLRGKVYAMGGSGFTAKNKGFLGEVYNPKMNRWNNIDGVSRPVTSDEKNNRLIVPLVLKDDASCPDTDYPHTKTSLYAYYPSSNTWKCLIEDVSYRWPDTNPAVTLDDDNSILFMHRVSFDDSVGISALDLSSKTWLSVGWQCSSSSIPYTVIGGDYDATGIIDTSEITQSISEGETHAMFYMADDILCVVRWSLYYADDFASICKPKIDLISLKMVRTSPEHLLLDPISLKVFFLAAGTTPDSFHLI